MPISKLSRVEESLDELNSRVDSVLADLRAQFASESRLPPDAKANTPRHFALARVDELEQLAVQFERNATSERNSADEWYSRAQLCVKAQDDDLARQALANRRQHVERAGKLESAAERARLAVGQMRAVLDSS